MCILGRRRQRVYYLRPPFNLLLIEEEKLMIREIRM